MSNLGIRGGALGSGTVTLLSPTTNTNRIITLPDETGTLLTTSAIGTDVQAFDATIVVDADIGTTVQAYDATIMVDGDIGTTVQAYDADLTTLATNGIGTSANQIVQLDGSAKLPAVDGSNLTGIESLPSQTSQSGKFLTTDGSAASWGDAGGLVYISKVSVPSSSPVSTIDIESGLDGTYGKYIILAETTSGAGYFHCRLKIGGTYLTGASDYSYQNTETLSSLNYSTITNDPTASAIHLMGTHYLNVTRVNYEFTISNVGDGGYKSIHWIGTQALTNQVRGHRGEGGAIGGGNNTAITGIRFYANGSTISGTFRLYGITTP